MDKIHATFRDKPLIKRDLLTIWRNCNTQYMLLDSELVQCRRRNKPTQHYITLAQHLDKMLTTLEKRITWAALL